jgi:hypothetical protein
VAVSCLQVKLNRGLDCVQLDDLLIDLKLTPDVLEVPVPRYFIEDRAQVSFWQSRNTSSHAEPAFGGVVPCASPTAAAVAFRCGHLTAVTATEIGV